MHRQSRLPASHVPLMVLWKKHQVTASSGATGHHVCSASPASRKRLCRGEGVSNRCRHGVSTSGPICAHRRDFT